MAHVFVCYESESALELVQNTICPAVEAAGISCWYAKRDAHPGPYSGQINRAIKECRIFLLVLNQEALHAAHILNETALAFRRFDKGERIALLPFRVDRCDLREDDDLDYFLVCQQIIDGYPPDARHIQDLVRNIKGILDAPS